jgi:hypothetical protein
LRVAKDGRDGKAACEFASVKARKDKRKKDKSARKKQR